ncbi:MAG: glycosyltransferase family 61 protein [Pseudomonadota bacterium]
MDKELPALSATSLPDAATETISRAVVAPMAAGAGMACGVFRPDGSFCDTSRTLLSAQRFTGIPDWTAPVDNLRGRHLFAGIGRHHFGHFLLESVCRLWPLGGDGAFDGIVIVPKQGIDFEAVYRRRLGSFIELLSGGLPVHFVTQPVEIETLVVPTQGMGHRRWTTGSEVFRRFVRERIAQTIKPEGPELLYISRSRLKRKDQMIDQEVRIEQLMQQSGYDVFHPQRHNVAAQCARYMAAGHIVGADGSAFHLAPMAMQPGTTVGLIARRARPEIIEALTAQIKAFCETDLVTIDAVLPGKVARGESVRIDFDKLSAALDAAGLI